MEISLDKLNDQLKPIITHQDVIGSDFIREEVYEAMVDIVKREMNNSIED